MKKALITGITGQDGSYLAEFLLEKGYEVHGIKRRASLFNTQRVDHIYEDPHIENSHFRLHYGDLTDSSNLTRLISEIQPDEVYNLGAISFAADWTVQTAIGSATASTVDITFNTAGSNTYNSLPATLALSNIPSLAAGDRTFVVINRPAGSFVTGPTSVGTLFGLLYDDAEQSQSFQITGGCQLSGVLSDSFPRTAPRFSTVIPAGRTGWMKVYNTNGTTGIVGSQVVYNLADNVNFWGGHNLHALTLTSSANTATLPVFPFELQTN